MAKNKKSKSLLNEATVRRMMKLADIPELSDSFVNETWGSDEHEYKREDSSTHPGRKDYMKEEDAEDELEATEDELEATEDEVADEEGAELDAEASGGDAEITPEAAQAIVDLAAQLEASGALEGGEEVVDAEAEVEMSDVGGEEEMEMSDVGGEEEVEVEDEEEFEGLEEALAKLGIEVVDDKKLSEAVRKRVIARLRKEKRAQVQEVKVNKIAGRIFARLRKK